MRSNRIQAPRPQARKLPERSQIAALLVDDDSFQLDLLEGVLNNLGVTNVTAAEGAPRA